MATSTKFADGYIALTLDLKEYREGLKRAKGEAETVGAQIRSAFKNPAEFSGKSPLAGMVADLGKGMSLAAALRAHIGVGLARDLKSLTLAPFNAGINAARTGLTAITGIAGRITSAFRALGPILQGIGVGIGLGAFLSLERVISRLVQAIPDLITAGRNYVNEVDQIVDVTGAAAEEASALVSALQFLGQDVSTVYIRLGQLSKTAQSNEAELNRLGVATRDVNGVFFNQVQLLNSLRSALSGMADGTDKARIEVLLFGGRGGLGQLVDFLKLTDEQMALLTAHFEEQGLIINEEQRAMGESALRAGKDIGNAYTGVATQLFNAVGPQIVAFLAGISKAITDNAAQIVAFVSSIVNTIIGLVQGLTGIALNFNSVAVAVNSMNAPLNESSFLLVEIDGKIADLEKSLADTGGEAANFNAGIDRQIRALQDSGKAVDAQIKRLDRLGATQDRSFRRGIDSLQRTLDLQLDLLDAEDQRLARAERDEQLKRGQEGAERGLRDAIRSRRDAIVDLAHAQAQLRKDEAEGLADLARARASGAGGAEIADIQIRNQETHENNIRAIIRAQEDLLDATESVNDAQGGVADAAGAVTEEGRRRAEEDRRATIAGLQEYVDNVAKIAEEENKTAALTTLKKREELLKQRQAEQAALGNTQAVADTQVQIDAVMAAEKKVQQDIIRADEQTALEKRKADLEAEIDAFRNSKTTQSSINKAEIQRQIADLKTQRAAEMAAIAARNKEAETLALNLKTINERTLNDYGKTFGPEGAIPAAFEASRLAGVKMAEDIKAAIGDLMDTLFGKEQAGPTAGGPGLRAGGLLGALSGIAGALGSVASGFGQLISGMQGFNPKDVGLSLVAAGVFFKSIPVIGAGLAMLGGAAYAEYTAGVARTVADSGFGVEDRPSDFTPEGEAGAAFRARGQATTNLFLLRKMDHGSVWKDSSVPGEHVGLAIARLEAEIRANKFTAGGFAKGGVVPGPKNAPFLATVHGGEGFIPTAVMDAINASQQQPVFAASGGGSMPSPATTDGYVLVKASSVLSENQLLDWLMPRMRQRRS